MAGAGSEVGFIGEVEIRAGWSGDPQTAGRYGKLQSATGGTDRLGLSSNPGLGMLLGSRRP